MKPLLYILILLLQIFYLSASPNLHPHPNSPKNTNLRKLELSSTDLDSTYFEDTNDYNSTTFSRKSNSGLSAAAIVAIVIPCSLALVAVGVTMALLGSSTAATGATSTVINVPNAVHSENHFNSTIGQIKEVKGDSVLQNK